MLAFEGKRLGIMDELSASRTLDTSYKQHDQDCMFKLLLALTKRWNKHMVGKMMQVSLNCHGARCH